MIAGSPEITFTVPLIDSKKILSVLSVLVIYINYVVLKSKALTLVNIFSAIYLYIYRLFMHKYR